MSRFRFSSVPVDLARLRAELADPTCGGYTAFEGWVRDHNEGQRVTRLEYEAFEALGVKEGERIIEEAQRRFGVARALCVHRVGELAIGDLAVWVGVSAAHRDEAFRACRYIIDEVKHRLPIWKKEHYESGDSGWVNCERCAAPGAEHVHEPAAAHPHASHVHGSGHTHEHPPDHGHAAPLPEPEEPAEIEVSFGSLDEALAAGFTVVDIREPIELAQVPTPAARSRHLPLGALLGGAGDLPAAEKSLLVCAHGARSLAAARELRSRGLPRVYSLRGGIFALAQRQRSRVGR